MKPASTADVAETLGVGRTKRSPALLAARKWGAIALGVVVLAVGGKALVARITRKPQTSYVTAEVARGDVRVTVTATGTLSALGSVEVGSEVSGRVQRVYVDYNEKVVKGQLLAEIDPVQLKAEATQAAAQLAANEAAVATARATLVEATQALDRAKAQLAKGLVAQKELETAQAAHARAEAAVASARANTALSSAQVGSSSWKLGKTKIVSPIDGVVLSRSIEPGQTVAATFQTPVLFKLATDLAALELHVQIDESDVGRIREGLGADFTVDAYPDKVFTSVVRSVRNEAKTTSNVVSYEAILTVDNSARLLRPGMTATAKITSELHSNVLYVPNAALRFQPSVAGGGGPPGAAPRSASVAPLEKGKGRLYLPFSAGARPLLADAVPPSVDVAIGATDGTNTEIADTSLAVGAKVVVEVAEGAP